MHMTILETSSAAPMVGFENSTLSSQRVFRKVLDAMSHPGKINSIDDLSDAPAPLHTATAAICLSLVDFETPLWVDDEITASGEATDYLRFHCGCPMTLDPMQARIGVVSGVDALTSFERFSIGTDERPDLSTTLILQVNDVSNEVGLVLSGPGIETTRDLRAKGVSSAFWDAVRANNALFPRGIDLILCAGARFVCLPRTTNVGG